MTNGNPVTRFIASVKKFYNTPFHEKCLFLEALVLLVRVRITIALIPMPRLWKKIGQLQHETPFEDVPHQHHFIFQVSRAIVRCRKVLRFNDRCYPEAITAKLMLRKRNIGSTLYVGVRKDPDKVLAHAWLRCGSIIVTGKREMTNFAVLSTIA
jgi:hypothetical protein